MVFSPTKPDPGPSPFLDAPQIQTDFSVWASTFVANHIGMNQVNQGDHSNVIFTNQSAGPPITQALAVLFAKNAIAASGTTPQLFVKIPVFLPTASDPTESPNPSAMQLTYGAVNTAGPQYQSFLPGGYVLYTGTTNNKALTITLSPAPTAIVMGIATSNTLAGSLPIVGAVPFTVGINVMSASTFKINSNASGPYTLTWWVLAQQ